MSRSAFESATSVKSSKAHSLLLLLLIVKQGSTIAGLELPPSSLVFFTTQPESFLKFSISVPSIFSRFFVCHLSTGTEGSLEVTVGPCTWSLLPT